MKHDSIGPGRRPKTWLFPGNRWHTGESPISSKWSGSNLHLSATGRSAGRKVVLPNLNGRWQQALKIDFWKRCLQRIEEQRMLQVFPAGNRAELLSLGLSGLVIGECGSVYEV